MPCVVVLDTEVGVVVVLDTDEGVVVVLDTDVGAGESLSHSKDTQTLKHNKNPNCC